MKRHELLDYLRRHGCALAREGSRGARAPVPRHGEIDNRLARKICEQLGIPPVR